MGGKIHDGLMVLMRWPKLVAKTSDIKLWVPPRSTNANVSSPTITPSMWITIELCTTIHSNMVVHTKISPLSFIPWFFIFSLSLRPISPRAAVWRNLFGHWMIPSVRSLLLSLSQYATICHRKILSQNVIGRIRQLLKVFLNLPLLWIGWPNMPFRKTIVHLSGLLFIYSQF